MDAKDYLIRTGLGMAKGFFANQVNQAQNARFEKEQARNEELLRLREERRIKLQAQLQAKNNQAVHQNNLAVKDHEYGLKMKAAQKGFENAVELEKIKGMGKKEKPAFSQKDILKIKKDLRDAYIKAGEQTDQFGEPIELPGFDEWARKNYPEQYDVAYSSGNKSRVKKGADIQAAFSDAQQIQLPQNGKPSGQPEIQSGASGPDIETPGKMPGPEMMSGHKSGHGDTPIIWDDVSSEVKGTSKKTAKVTRAIDNKIKKSPKSVDLGQILGLVAKGVVNVGELSVESLKILNTALQETGNMSRAITDPYVQLAKKVNQALVNAGAYMLAPESYSDKVKRIDQAKTK